MSQYIGDEYNSIKEWIADHIRSGASWNEAENLFVGEEEAEDEFLRQQEEELRIPLSMEFSEWKDFVDSLRANYIPIVDLYGIADKETNSLPVPTADGSAWVKYKNYLRGKPSGKRKMSDESVASVENNCHWILNHLERDTRTVGAVKGLVMGSVQSGKTANMVGLVTMAADYDWNIFIILSGTIENLRKQTRDRFYSDLTRSKGGVSWHVLDYCSEPDYMTDISSNIRYLTDDLEMNLFLPDSHKNKWLHRYVFVCLKNKSRLTKLIKWLHSNAAKAARMRVLVIDDEADQASVNTAKMADPEDDEEINRTAINQLIIDLVKGNDENGNVSAKPFQAMNYVSFTATPYANVLNEAYADSLYPGNFICSLPEANEYFGPKVIWGSKDDENFNGLNIVRTIPPEEMKELKLLHKGMLSSLPAEFQKAVAWFLCAAAVLRNRGHKKPISMLIHTTQLQAGQFKEYDVLRQWLCNSSNQIVMLCETVYEEEKDEFRLDDLEEGYPNYGRISTVNDEFPDFTDIEGEIRMMLHEIVNIKMGDDGERIYRDDAVHLCVDNCRANKVAEEGTYLRIVYPSEKESSVLNKAPVFIVMGGNTLSRGLTLEGLVCTYFARNVNQADTLFQMGRWFGYRQGYELLQRIWMPYSVQQKFELISEIDEKLKDEFEDFMRKGKSPSQFGPRIMSSSRVARFLLTSKNKSQNMVSADFDFSGDSYETTKFENAEEQLQNNINITEEFLSALGTAEGSDAIDSAYVWRNIDSETVLSEFIDHYIIADGFSLREDISIFKTWMRQMNEDGKYLKWNVAVAGDKKAAERWKVSGADVGKIERSRKIKPPFIDIGSLRSGRDILSDISIKELDAEQQKKFYAGKKSGKNLIRLRYDVGMGDVPLLLLYRIDKEKGKDSKYRSKIKSVCDIIGFSIVIAGQESSSDYVKTVTVKRPE